MDLTLHLFRKDVRQFRILLAIWFALLLLHLGMDFGWVGQVVYSSQSGFDRASNVWTGLLPVVVWALVGLLPSLVVLTDSPARHEGFLATRPVPKCDLILAKMLFILALIIVPWVLVEFIYLSGSGVPGWVVSRGTLERLLFTVPVTFGCGAYAALWPGTGRWARSLAIIFGCYIVGGITLSLCQIFFQINFPLDSSKAPPLVILIWLMLVLVAFSIWHARGHRGVLARWGGLVLVAAACFIPQSLWPWKTFALRPVDPSAVQAMMGQSRFEVRPRDFTLQKIERPGHAPQFNLAITPKSQPVPGTYTVEWSGHDAKLLSDNGVEARGEQFGGDRIFGSYYWAPSVSYHDFVAWTPEFPSDVMFRQDNYMGFSEDSISFGSFDLPSAQEELTARRTLQAEIESRVFKWSKIADLPLTPGASAADEFGSWKFIAAQTLPPTAQMGQIYLQRRQIALTTASDSRCASAEDGPLARMAFLIYDPTNHTAWLSSQQYGSDITRSTDSALTQYFQVLSYNDRKPFTPAEIARCRLMIFEKTWIGTVPEHWESPAFTINDKLPAFAPQPMNGESMPLADFNRRVAALNVPGPDATRRDVSLYLLEFFRLVDARRFTMSLQDPHTQQLAKLVPAHLDLMLDGLPVMDYPSKESVLNAIILGATEAQKPVIIAALQTEPELARVLLARGWVKDARPEILQLTQSPHRLPLEAMQAIASFQDSNTYPRLLEEFDAGPGTEADHVLRTLPGLDVQMGEIVSRHWYHDGLIFRRQDGWQMFGQSFQLALSYGQTSALQRAYLFLDDPDFEKGQMNFSYYLANSLRSEIWMPDLKPPMRNDNEAVHAWMRKHRPEDFVYNPALRQFVLKSDLSTGPIADDSHP